MSVISVAELAARPRATADWIVQGLLKRGNTLVMMGQPKKAAKSWLLLDMAWSLALGECVWGMKWLVPPKPMRTVYFTQEDTEDDIQDRVMAHIGAGRRTSDRLWIVPKNLQAVLDTVEGKQLVQAQLDRVRDSAGAVDLVVFDPLRRMHHGDEDSSEVMVGLWGTIDRIHRRYGCATALAHHIRKPPQDKRGYDPTDPFIGRGSGDLYGGGDAFVMVVPRQGTEEWRRTGLYFETKRSRQLAPAEVKVVFGTGRVEWLGAGWERKDEEDVSI